MEKALGAFSQLLLERFGVFEADLGVDLGQAAAFDIGLHFGFHFGDFAPKFLEDTFALDGVDVHRNVQAVIEVD